MKEREVRTAIRYGNLDKIEKLEKELLSIHGVSEIDFDLDGFYDNMHQVIIIIGFGNIHLASKTYFQERKELLKRALEVCANNGLSRSEDSIENMGEHFYIVFKHDNTWNTSRNV